jgi:hypothetical protein
LVVEKLIATVSGVHGRVPSRSAVPAQRSTTVSPRSRTVRAPPPAPRPTSLAKASATGANPGAVLPSTTVCRTEGPVGGRRPERRSRTRTRAAYGATCLSRIAWCQSNMAVILRHAERITDQGAPLPTDGREHRGFRGLNEALLSFGGASCSSRTRAGRRGFETVPARSRTGAGSIERTAGRARGDVQPGAKRCGDRTSEQVATRFETASAGARVAPNPGSLEGASRACGQRDVRPPEPYVVGGRRLPQRAQKRAQPVPLRLHASGPDRGACP